MAQGVTFYIDGFNFYYAISRPEEKKGGVREIDNLVEGTPT